MNLTNHTDFTKMVSTPPMRTDQVVRYSGVRMTDPENLSMHIVDVQVLGYSIIKTLNENFSEGLDVGVFLEKALLHDMDEVLTGDMPRSTKYYNDTILQEMKTVASDAMRQLSGDFFKGTDAYDLWDGSKDGKEGYIVKIADMLVVAVKVMKEVDMLGNMYFLKIAYEVRTYLSQTIEYTKSHSPLSEEASEYLIGILTEARDNVNRIWNEHKELAERYGILDNVFMGKGGTN